MLWAPLLKCSQGQWMNDRKSWSSLNSGVLDLRNRILREQVWEQDSWAKTTLRAKEFLSRKRFFKSPVRLSWLHFTQAKNQQASSIIKVFRLLPGQRANGQTHPRIHFLIWKLSECLQPLAIHEFHEFLWLSISKMSKKTCDHQESSSKHFEHHAVCQQFFC